MTRLVILAFLCLPALAYGQAKEDEADKVSNDRPDRPLQMPPASSEVKEALDDFERFRRRGAWERALKSLFSIPEAQSLRFVDGQNGYIISVANKRREVLAGLTSDGQAAYRLFYDDEAKKLLEEAEGPTELKTLERIFSAYFHTSVGDNAADRLGDFYFEIGRFDRAADCWLAILRDRPDSDLSPALISVKAAMALARAGRKGEVATLRRDLAEKYAGEKISLGGRSVPAIEHLNGFLGSDGAVKGVAAESTGSSGAETMPDLARPIPPVWQMRFGESVVAGMTPQELTQWESNGLSGTVPPAAVEGTSLYANLLGYVFAVNLETGKLLWRSASFHNMEIPASQDQARMLDVKRFAILASKGYVWTLGRDLADPNQMASFRISCRRADTGDVIWQTTDLPDYSQLDLVGTPILDDETLYVVAKTPMNMQQGLAQQFVLAVRARDGKVLWKTEVGTFRQTQRFYYYGMSDSSPQPRLIFQAGSIYVDTHVGVLARLDAASGEIDWGYAYQTEPVEAMNRFFFFGYTQPTETSSSSGPLHSGGTLYGKGVKSERIYALNADNRTLLWDRPIAKSARILGADDRILFLGGPEISALDLKTRKLLWSTRLPGGSNEGRVLLRAAGLWQLTPRGIFELDPRSGQVRRIFRGEDTGSAGGDLYLSGRLLLAVTNRTISAYPIAPTVTGNPVGLGEKPANHQTRASDD